MPELNVLFVCLGNICRSPMAEAVFDHEAKKRGYSIGVDSAGAFPHAAPGLSSRAHRFASLLPFFGCEQAREPITWGMSLILGPSHSFWLGLFSAQAIPGADCIWRMRSSTTARPNQSSPLLLLRPRLRPFRTVSTCTKHSIPISSHARQVASSDYTAFHTIFAMDAQNLSNLERGRPRGSTAKGAFGQMDQVCSDESAS